MTTAPSSEPKPHHLTLPEWPKLAWGDEQIDGLIPVCRLKYWRRFESALGNKLMNPRGGELIFRGQKRQEWQLTPTLGRYPPSGPGVVDPKRAAEQKREFRLAMRGRGIGPELLDDDNELWAFGQHHGLATPLLDWTKSPFVALFFAFADPDFPYEEANPSRAIFVINKTALEALDSELIVQPLRNDHTRLVNQAGLFTLSPSGSETLETRILNLLSETQTVNMDDPEAVGRYIFKIHIPNSVEERRDCLSMLRKMNIHHGSLFPDPIGASLYCNEWFGGRVDEPDPEPEKTATPSKKPPARPARQPIKPSGSAAAPPNIEAQVFRVLRSEGLDSKQVSILAGDLAAKFHATAPIDWSGRAFGHASVSVDIKRILRMNGVPNEKIEPVAAATLELFASLASSPSSEMGAAE